MPDELWYKMFPDAKAMDELTRVFQLHEIRKRIEAFLETDSKPRMFIIGHPRRTLWPLDAKVRVNRRLRRRMSHARERNDPIRFPAARGLDLLQRTSPDTVGLVIPVAPVDRTDGNPNQHRPHKPSAGVGQIGTGLGNFRPPAMR